MTDAEIEARCKHLAGQRGLDISTLAVHHLPNDEKLNSNSYRFDADSNKLVALDGVKRLKKARSSI